MDLIFNELSLLRKVGDKHSARLVMENLLLCCKAARNFWGKMGLRVNDDFFSAELTENYSVTSWLNDCAVSQNLKTLLLGLKRSPYIDDNDENIENTFIQNYYYLYAPDKENLHEKEVEGLAVAFLYNTLAVSLQTDIFWDQPYISLLEKHDENKQTVKVKHFNTPGRIRDHQEWIEAHRPVVLIESTLSNAEKEISLRDDHGKDILQTFSQKLLRSPYVEKVINSLPFNPHSRSFIKNISPDGKIEFVLVGTDQGLGCVVQTSGRNLQETKRIAEILEDTYGK